MRISSIKHALVATDASRESKATGQGERTVKNWVMRSLLGGMVPSQWKSRSRSRSPWLVLVSVLALVLVACGGGESDGSENETDAAGAGTSTATEQSTEDAAGATETQTAASGEAFPSRRIDIVVPYGVGGGGDSTTRPIAAAAAEYTDVPVRVINMPGAGSIEGTQFVAEAEPDGHTMLMATGAIILTTLIEDPGYSPDDFIPVAIMTGGGITFVINTDSPYETLDDIVKADITYGTSGTGSSAHAVTAAFADQVGANWTHVPFDGTGAAILALRGGDVDMVPTIGTGAWGDAVEQGELAVLANTAPERADSLPDVPTVSELGYDFEMVSWRGYFVPAGTPMERVEYLENLLRQIHEDEGFRSQIQQREDVYPFVGHEKFAEIMERDTGIYRDLTDELYGE